MIGALLRKARQVGQDPVLRCWLLERALGRTPAPPTFTAHRPPYLGAFDLGAAPGFDSRFSVLAAPLPTRPLNLDLAGLEVTIQPNEAAALFGHAFDDIEQYLALQRFAWIDADSDPAWVVLLWSEWLKRFAQPDSSWAWHPYTAAERAIHLLDFAEKFGLPEPVLESCDVLASHVPVIASHLEYFGPHYTGNHLANNGRGLFRLGLGLGWNQAADLGSQILLQEARRIFGSSGVLNEGSTHYHLLLAKNYAEAALWAAKAKWPQADALQAIADRAHHAAGGLMLISGLPLIGDISPDLPPAKLCPLFERSDADLSADGWHRLEAGSWSLLLYAPPDGWVPMPGHGHQDLGSFELHWKGVPLIVDPGRGRYGEEGDAALYRRAAVHNGLTFAGRDPRPMNRPYYAREFRSRLGGAPPKVVHSDSSLALTFPMGKALVSRNFQIDGDSFIIRDRVEGRGQQDILRGLATPFPVRLFNEYADIDTGQGLMRIKADAPWRADSIIRWTGYGRGQTAARLQIGGLASLPWQGALTFEAC